MDDDLLGLLRETCTEIRDASKYSHYTCYDPQARWKLNMQNSTEFWKSYCDMVYHSNNSIDSVNFKNGKNDIEMRNFNLCEAPQEFMPIILDIKFRFLDKKEGTWDEIYSDKFINHLVYICQQGIEELLELDNELQGLEFVAIMLESSDLWLEIDGDNRYVNSRLRIQFPYAVVESTFLQKRFIPYVIQKVQTNNIFQHIENLPIGDISKMFTDVYNKPVLMFGSEEVADRPVLKLHQCFGCITEDVLKGDSNGDTYDLFDICTPLYSSMVINKVVDSQIFDNYCNCEEIEYWLPFFLSMGYCTQICKVKSSKVIISPQTVNKTQRRITPQQIQAVLQNRSKIQVFGLFEDETLLKICDDLLKIVDENRCMSENGFFDIGRAFYHADQGSENAFNSWIKYIHKVYHNIEELPPFIKTTAKYSLASSIEDKLIEFCRTNWNNLQYGNITWKTLAFYAMKDNETKFGKWHQEWSSKSMDKALSCTHHDVAVAFYRCYFIYFIYSNKKWYRFNGNRWQECEEGIYLTEIMSSDFCRRFEKIQNYYTQNNLLTNDENVKAENQTKIKLLAVLIDKLKKQPFLGPALTNLRGKFLFHKFTSIIDSNVNTLSVSNGMLEVVGNGIVFRHAKPEDYIQMGSEICYNPEYSEDHYLVRECMDWFEQLFEDQDTIDYYLKFGASIIQGRNRDKIFMIWSGNGNNGKSILEKAFEKVFGEYCIKFPINMLTDKSRRGGGPSPELARAKNKRVVFIDEPEDNMEMSKGTVKSITGGDRFFARSLFENGEDVVATFKTILLCNRVPVFTNPDQAIRNRTRKLFFNVTYSAEASKDLEQQKKDRIFPIDVNFENRLSELAPAILWIFVQKFSQYIDEGLIEPQSVKDATAKYWEENDYWNQFFSEKLAPAYVDEINKIPDMNAIVSLTQLHTEFVAWYKVCFNGDKPPSRKELKSTMEERYCKIDKNGWRGLKIIDDDNHNNTSLVVKDKSKAFMDMKAEIMKEKQREMVSPNNRGLSPITESSIRNIETFSHTSPKVSDAYKSPKSNKLLSPNIKQLSPVVKPNVKLTISPIIKNRSPSKFITDGLNNFTNPVLEL